MYGVDLLGVKNARVDIKLFGDYIEHLPGGGILGVLVLESDLIVGGSNIAIALGCHCLEECTEHLAAILGGVVCDAPRGHLVVSVAAVVILICIEHRDRNDAVNLFHSAEVLALGLDNA